MVKNTFNNATIYEAPGHHGVISRRFHGKEETGAQKFRVCMSTFEPGGGAGWGHGDDDSEIVYFMIEGEMTVRDRNGNEWKIGPEDSFSMGPNQERWFGNESNSESKVVVVATYSGI